MSPGLRAAVQRVLPESVKGVAGPAFGRLMDRLQVPPSGLRAGRDVTRRAGDARPVVLVLQLGAPSAQAVADTVAVLVRVAGQPGGAASGGAASGGAASGGAASGLGVRPVLVLDTPHLAVVRRAGLAVDHLTARADWERRHPGVPYAEHLAERLAGMRRDYATAAVLSVPAQGWGSASDDDVVALLRPTPLHGARRWWQPLAVRAERLVDRSG